MYVSVSLIVASNFRSELVFHVSLIGSTYLVCIGALTQGSTLQDGNSHDTVLPTYCFICT